jgi:SNF2 family DNA or RNA helicase
MIRAEVAGEFANIIGPFPFPFVRLLNGLSGRKQWNSSKSVRILATAGNIRLLKSSDYDIEWIDKSGDLAAQQELEALATQHSTIELPKSAYQPKIKLYEYQQRILALSWNRTHYALLLEMGLGKTAILLSTAGMLHAAGKVTGVLVIAPKGVHRQWIESEIPKHMGEGIPLGSEFSPVHTILWKVGGNGIDVNKANKRGLTFFAMNTDSIRTKAGASAAIQFLNAHHGRSLLIADESHNYKTPGTDRTKALLALGQYATYRRIATGTPIAKNIIDAWTQFNFLDPRILGHKYMTSFRARYCIMGGWEGKQIIGQKNTEEFYGLIAPHAYRLTKAEAIDLPEKDYVIREYEMGEQTARHYKELKTTFMTELDNGSIVDVPTAAVALIRLQQIVCGYLPTEEGIEHISNERIDQVIEIIKQVNGPVIIWTRFRESLHNLIAALEKEEGAGCAVNYYGGTSTTDRQIAVKRFLDGSARFFVSNPAAGGVGLNLQGECRNVIYFANDFNYVSRIQSEDRVHRIGTTGSVTYFDLVARKTIDRMILRNLRAKSDLSRLTFDEIRQAITEM